MQLIKSATVVILGTNKFSQTAEAEGVLFHPYHVAFVLPLEGRRVLRKVGCLGCHPTPSLVGAEDETSIVDIIFLNSWQKQS